MPSCIEILKAQVLESGAYRATIRTLTDFPDRIFPFSASTEAWIDAQFRHGPGSAARRRGDISRAKVAEMNRAEVSPEALLADLAAEQEILELLHEKRWQMYAQGFPAARAALEAEIVV
ncbi:hypothetical protein BJH93_10565 [Kocuria polaris]|nr:hypothetical protein [Kocuria polaris]